ncbi:MAG: hypothetical protein ACJAWS_000955 [Oleiphilaceae bacterium]|jgi:hypothetical protein
MKALLEIINRATYQAEGMLSTEQQQRHRLYYHRLLSQADRECPGRMYPLPITKVKGTLG